MQQERKTLHRWNPDEKTSNNFLDKMFFLYHKTHSKLSDLKARTMIPSFLTSVISVVVGVVVVVIVAAGTVARLA
jgi:hypothetical protein